MRTVSRPGSVLLTSLAAGLLFGPAGVRPARAQVPVRLDAPAPAWVAGSWLNTPGGRPVSIGTPDGRVKVVHFWTFECINCKHNLPAYARWQRRFKRDGVEIIGVHTPETAYERDPAHVARALRQLRITYPVLIDSGAGNWTRWRQQYWPTVYLVDKRGRVRYRWEGELGDGEENMARLIDRLAREPGPRPSGASP